MARESREDREIQEYRDILRPPETFEDGFGAKTIVGAVFLGLFMLPGSMYLMLFMGAGLGPAARWVTVILFAEVARRSLKDLRQQEVFILFYMTGVALGTPFQGLLWKQYLVQSDAAQAMGVASQIPSWVAPQAEILKATGNTFLTRHWLAPILLISFQLVITRANGFGLGYALYRLTAHAEKLPFPMAPVQAQGVLALTEGHESRERWRWTAFAIGGVLGLLFGFLYVGVPSLSGSLLGTPYKLLPIPWLDLTPRLSRPDFLPAMPINLVFDLSLVIVGMVLPFWAMVGGFAGLLITLVANPMLYRMGILHQWRPGMGVVDTLYANTVDFYLAFSIGLAFAIFCISIGGLLQALLKRWFGEISGWIARPLYLCLFLGVLMLDRTWGAAVLIAGLAYGVGALAWLWRRGRIEAFPTLGLAPVFGCAVAAAVAGRGLLGTGVLAVGLTWTIGVLFRSLRRAQPEGPAPSNGSAGRRGGSWREVFRTNRLRGDIPVWISLLIYILSTFLYIGLCRYLLGPSFPVVFFLVFAFAYTPVISYTTAKLEGMVGQTITVPLVREAAFILSGYKGVAIWFAPIPLTDYGRRTQSFRVVELTGTRVTSLIKTELVTIPVVLVAGFLFSEFIWRLGPIPSEAYPFTQEVWRLNAKMACLRYTATMEGGSPFLEALRPDVVRLGLGTGVTSFLLLRLLGLPTLLVYGVVRGFGQTTPGQVLLEFIGALLGRFYLQRRFGRQRWRRIAPVVLAGFSCGIGLMAMASVGIALLAKSISARLY